MRTKHEFWSKQMFRKFTPSSLYFTHKVGTKNIRGEWEEWSKEKFGLEKVVNIQLGEEKAGAKEWPQSMGCEGLRTVQKRKPPTCICNKRGLNKQTTGQPDTGTLRYSHEKRHICSFMSSARRSQYCWDEQNQVKIYIFAKKYKCIYLCNKNVWQVIHQKVNMF